MVKICEASLLCLHKTTVERHIPWWPAELRRILTLEILARYSAAVASTGVSL